MSKDILQVVEEGLELATEQGGECIVKAEVFERLIREIRKLRAGSNYVADREIEPTCVWFSDGRKVTLVTRVEKGRIVGAYLDVTNVPVYRLATDTLEVPESSVT